MSKINIEDLAKKYPKSLEKLKEYFKNKTKEIDLPEEFKNYEISDTVLNKMLETTPRSFFDFFDGFNIIILPDYKKDTKSFYIDIVIPEANRIEDISSFSKRLEAELHSLPLAFYQLEERLVANG